MKNCKPTPPQSFEKFRSDEKRRWNDRQKELSKEIREKNDETTAITRSLNDSFRTKLLAELDMAGLRDAARLEMKNTVDDAIVRWTVNLKDDRKKIDDAESKIHQLVMGALEMAYTSEKDKAGDARMAG